MTVHRFFVGPEEAAADRFPLPTSIAHQVRDVLRLRDGDPIVLLTGDGFETACRLDGAECVVEDRRVAGGEPAHRLTIVQALLKADALEEVVRQGTEVGVDAFRLVVTERCVVRELAPRKLERLRAIARESAEQSERGRVPSVGAPEALLTAVGPGTVVLAERERDVRLREVPVPAAVVVGPEGGFGARELDAAVAAGAVLAGLGPRILRSRTVAVAAAATVLSRTGDFA